MTESTTGDSRRGGRDDLLGFARACETDTRPEMLVAAEPAEAWLTGGFMFLRTLLVVVSLSILSAHAGAVEVYFNGTRVTGLKSQSFDNCSVRFDASGNVHVTAKGYKVKRLTEPGKGGAPPKATSPKQYFIYSEARRPGYAQYDVDVYINDSVNDIYLVKQVPIAAGGALQVLDGGAKVVVQSGDALKVVSDTASSVDVWVSAVDDIST